MLARVGKPLRIAIPCAGLKPGAPVTVKVFEQDGLGGDPVDTLQTKVGQDGGSAEVDWSYDHAKLKDKVHRACLVFLVEGAGRVSLSEPVQFVDVFEATIKDAQGQPAADRLVRLHPDRGETVPAATNAEGKLRVEVPPGDYHVEICGPAPPDLPRPPVDEASDVAAKAAAAKAAAAAAAAGTAAAAGDIGGGGGAGSAASKHYVEVHLVESDGRPARNAKVVLVAGDGSRHDGRTDEKGDVRWEGVPEGEATLELVGDEFVPDTEEPAAEAPPPPPRPASTAGPTDSGPVEELYDVADEKQPVFEERGA